MTVPTRSKTPAADAGLPIPDVPAHLPISLFRLGSSQNSPLRTFRRLCILCQPCVTKLREFIERVVHLQPGHIRPIPDLPPLQFCVRLVTMHGPLRQQTE